MSKIFEWEVPLQGSIYWSGGGGASPSNVSAPPPKKKFSWEKNIRLFQIKIFFDDDFKKSVKLLMSRNAISANPDDQTSQLPIRNLLSYDAQTWWLLVFILKARSNHILAKLINRGGGVTAALFSSRCHKKLENEKIFLCLKISEIDMRA